MVTRKSAMLPSTDRAELACLFTDDAILKVVEMRDRAKAEAAAAKKAAGPEVEYLVVKRVNPLVAQVFTKLGYGTASERSEVRYLPGWQTERLTAKGSVFAHSAEEATLKAQRRALGDKKGTLDADEAAYWANHLAQGTWGHGKYAAQAAPVRAIAVQDLSKCPVKGDVPVTPDIKKLQQRIDYWSKDGDKEMVKALKGMLRDAMRIKA